MRKGERKERPHLNMGYDGLNLGKPSYAEYLRIYEKKMKKIWDKKMEKARKARDDRRKKKIDIRIKGTKNWHL